MRSPGLLSLEHPGSPRSMFPKPSPSFLPETSAAEGCDDFAAIFPASGVGDSPSKSFRFVSPSPAVSGPCPPLSLSLPVAQAGGAAATPSPATPNGGTSTAAYPAKEDILRVASSVGSDDGEFAGQETPAILSRLGAGMLTIDPGGEFVPTELEKKRAKLARYRHMCSEVVDSFMYVGGEEAAKDERLLSRSGITHILNCAGPQCPNFLEHTGRYKYMKLNFYDHCTEDATWFIYAAFDFIKEAASVKGGRVLIHCVQGVSRSCTLAIAWMMLTRGLDYEEAYQRVRQGRPICAPNTGFICCLLEWQRRRELPPPNPFMFRGAWHVPLFPEDVVLKLCIFEDLDRRLVIPSSAALDARTCYLLVSGSELVREAGCAEEGNDEVGAGGGAGGGAVTGGAAEMGGLPVASGSGETSTTRVNDQGKCAGVGVGTEGGGKRCPSRRVYIWRGSESHRKSSAKV
ncbi:unnamed protein product [Choristocarpus tenellus]